MIDYKKRLVEVDEVLNHLSEEEYSKISDEVKQLIKENKDKEYTWVYDESKTLKEQNLNRDTISILSYINMEYLLNDEQKQLMMQLHQVNEKKKRNKDKGAVAENNIENIFKKNGINNNENSISPQIEIIEQKPDNFWGKLLRKIRNIIYKM